ncbi:MAG: carboxypeptidase regulatory-like domain-containing protein, partial [Salibacteraceae bacterium]|nr:carboxypeptidase regulatory-like domain-containing protein [Salibacteraceae bacterium]
AFASASGGTAPYAYSWSNGATTATINGLCAGTYNVTVTDANGNTATSSTTVGSTGGVGVQISGNSDCFGASLVANVSSGTAPFTYQWSNGLTAQGAYYPSSGSAYADVTVTDANGCSGMDSTFLSFAATFTVSASATNETCLTCCDGTASVSTSGGPSNSPFAYSWSNGDNSASISGLCPGTYSVTVTDTLNGCDVTSSVTIGAFTCPTISGNITQGEGAMVYLIEENSGVLTAVDSVVSDSMGYYYFFNACPSTYYVKAALLPSHSLYAYHVPTYYVSSSLWATATAVIVSGNTTGIDINLLTGTNLGGPGFIGGAVSQGANRGEGDPVIGAQVILLDANGNVSAFTTTDANGEYSFENLAYGNYSVYVEMINFDAFPFEVVVSADNEEVQNRNFVVEGGKIKPVTPLGVNALSAVSFEMYPNPANGLVTFTGTVDQVEIINILGETVLVKSNNGAANMNLDITSLTSGQYIVSVKQGEQNSFVKLIVQ